MIYKDSIIKITIVEDSATNSNGFGLCFDRSGVCVCRQHTNRCLLLRLFTTATEVGESLLFLGSRLAFVLNWLFRFEMWLWLYCNADAEAKGVDILTIYASEKDNGYGRPAQVDIIVTPSSLSGCGRLWDCKVE